jgi:hypothetical protein
MIHYNQKFTEYIVAGGLGSCFGRSIYEMFSDYFKIPAGPGYVSSDLEKIPSVKCKTPLILQSTQDSNLNLDSGSGEGSSTIPVETKGVGSPGGTRTPPSYPGHGTAEQEEFYRLSEPTHL